MVIRGILPLRGPNRWTRAPVLEVRIDTDTVDGGAERAIVAPRRVEEILRSVQTPITPPHDALQLSKACTGTPSPHELLGPTAVMLQVLVESPVRFSSWTKGERAGEAFVVVEFEEEPLGRAALDRAARLIAAVFRAEEFDFQAEYQSLWELADRCRLGPSTAAIVAAARQRRIPFQRIGTNNLVQLGQGTHLHRAWTAQTDRTSSLATEIASDKVLAKSMLTRIGIPVPQGCLVASRTDAWEKACELGLPVVVKPRDMNRARGVSINLRTRDQIENAFDIARFILPQRKSEVLVEQYIAGTEHRLLVVGGKLVAAYRGEPATVVGDGQHTVAELIAKLNEDPQRGPQESCPRYQIELSEVTEMVLAGQGLTFDSVPDPGARVTVRRNADHCYELTDRVHPETAALAVEAARFIGLDITGIDLIAKDISRPLREQGGAIIEINAGPGLINHLKPDEGVAQPVGAAILETMYPVGDEGRVPLLGITGASPARTAAARLAARVLRQAGRRVGLTCAEGLFVEDRLVLDGDRSGWQGARDLLINSAVEIAVIEVSPESIRSEGLGFDRCHVALVLGPPDEPDRDEITQVDVETVPDPIDVLRTATGERTSVRVEAPLPCDTGSPTETIDRATRETSLLTDRQLDALQAACRVVRSLVS